MINECYIGDVRDGLRSFIAAGVRAQTCVTSPPYWGLRDYGTPGQIGLEPTIAEYVANMVDVFRLVRDVLADDGTLWLNLGDSYASDTKGSGGPDSSSTLVGTPASGNGQRFQSRKMAHGLKQKDLCGIPWRVAFALQSDGWYLRSDIIWHKPNPMPESVTDRPTKSHEYLFLLAKSERYFYDAAAIAEPATYAGKVVTLGEKSLSKGQANGLGIDPSGNGAATSVTVASQRNRRSVWTIATEPYADAHFATFPTALVEPCVLVGTSVHDVVLDPFMGSGTVAQVAQSLGRRWIGCELSSIYAEMIKNRSAQIGMAFA